MPRKFIYYNSKIPIDPLTDAFVDAADGLGVTIIEPLYSNLNKFYRAVRASGEIPNIGFCYVEAMANSEYSEADRKKISCIDLFDSTQIATLRNDYTGSHVAGKGWAGSDNTKKFGVLTAFNPSTSSVWNQNDAQYWVLFLDGETSLNHWDIGSANAGFTEFNAVIRSYKNDGIMLTQDTLIVPFYPYFTFKGNSPSWWGSIRVSSSLAYEYINNALAGTTTDTSCIEYNSNIARFGAFNTVGWTDGFYGERPQGAIFGGSSSLNGVLITKLINTHLLSPGGTEAYMNKNIFIMGDSIFSNHSLGKHGRAGRRTVSTLNDNWTVTNIAVPNLEATDIDNDFSMNTAPYYSSYYSKNIFILTAGTNGIANGTETGIQCYNKIKSICTKAKAAGWQKVVISGIIDRQGLLMISQGTFDTEVAAYQALMLADFNTSTAIPNYYTSSLVSYANGFIDLYSDVRYQDATSATYYNADKVHLSDLGNDDFSDDYLTPIIQTF